VEPVTPVAPAAPPTPRKPTPEESGYDPDTGQVLDAAKYQRWQKAQKEVKTEVAAGETVYEVFIRANRALQDWIDLEANRPLLLGGINACRNDPSLMALVASFDQWGQDFRDRFWRRVEFMVENRREFYSTKPGG
jgi:hypothetical protein